MKTEKLVKEIKTIITKFKEYELNLKYQYPVYYKIFKKELTNLLER